MNFTSGRNWIHAIYLRKQTAFKFEFHETQEVCTFFIIIECKCLYGFLQPVIALVVLWPGCMPTEINRINCERLLSLLKSAVQ